ncbi:MAG: shikimate dehydrogenase [Chthoniobacterales bacterium]|nr:shikimate dehydrogenase [Chthoniobacterales bacterium]
MRKFHTLADLRDWKPGPIRLGLLGDPVAHSLSPEMQNAALAECGFAPRYARFRILPNELGEALRLCAERDFIGVNLTVPHKVAGFALVEVEDQFARQAGAINTIRFEEGKLFGTNTDGPGFVRAIRESFNVELRDLRVLVLGAGGGAGQAVAATCALAGCPALTLVNRDFTKAQTLAARFPHRQILAVPWEATSLGKALAQTDLIVHATPLGLQPNDPAPLPCELLAPCHLTYDLNYGPTAFLAAAREAGARAASGLTMLLHQGALAFEFWFDRPAPLAVMRRALGF